MPIVQKVYQRIKISLQKIKRQIVYSSLSLEKAPIIFGNAMPKSGSHLLLQILQGICNIGPFIEVAGGPIRGITPQDRRIRSTGEMLNDLRALKPGDVAWGYLDPVPEIVSFLCRREIVNYLIIRDPRDMLVSHVFYATTMHSGHRMHQYYKSLDNFDDCLKVAIHGINKNGLKLPSVRERYESMTEWFEQPPVMVIRFEDLINNRKQTINAMLDHLGSSGYESKLPRELAVQRIIAAIKPQRSGTFRKGIVGDWRNYFKEEHKRLFQENAANLLIRFGYEKNNDW